MTRPPLTGIIGAALVALAAPTASFADYPSGDFSTSTGNQVVQQGPRLLQVTSQYSVASLDLRTAEEREVSFGCGPAGQAPAWVMRIDPATLLATPDAVFASASVARPVLSGWSPDSWPDAPTDTSLCASIMALGGSGTDYFTGLMRSDDGGLTWRVVPGPTEGTLFTATDGALWTAPGDDLPATARLVGDSWLSATTFTAPGEKQPRWTQTSPTSGVRILGQPRGPVQDVAIRALEWASPQGSMSAVKPRVRTTTRVVGTGFGEFSCPVQRSIGIRQLSASGRAIAFSSDGGSMIASTVGTMTVACTGYGGIGSIRLRPGSKVLGYVATHLMRSTDRGRTWRRISVPPRVGQPVWIDGSAMYGVAENDRRCPPTEIASRRAAISVATGRRVRLVGCAAGWF